MVKDGSDVHALTKNMKKGLDEFGVVRCEIEIPVFDGIYFHCSIKKLLNSLYGLKEVTSSTAMMRCTKVGLSIAICARKENLRGRCCYSSLSTVVPFI